MHFWWREPCGFEVAAELHFAMLCRLTSCRGLSPRCNLLPMRTLLEKVRWIPKRLQGCLTKDSYFLHSLLSLSESQSYLLQFCFFIPNPCVPASHPPRCICFTKPSIDFSPPLPPSCKASIINKHICPPRQTEPRPGRAPLHFNHL